MTAASAHARNPRMRYPPIAEHGVIGDLHTVALVAVDGTIDWYCCPSFDSPSVFAALLDADRGGFFRIAPVEVVSSQATVLRRIVSGADRERRSDHKQLYFPDTNVLITRFLDADGVCEVQDFMPIQRGSPERQRHRLIRRVLGVRGTLRLRMECAPAFDYGREPHETVIGEHGATFHTRDLSLSLASPCRSSAASRVCSRISRCRRERPRRSCLERVTRGHRRDGPVEPEETEAAFEDTLAFWRRWLATSGYRGRWREMVHRSALMLKLLTYAPTGAIVAAPTAALPEVIGGERNWDYRYTWVRDAAFTVYALLRLGFTEEAAAFMDWLEARAEEAHEGPNGPLQIMYGIDGRHDIPEHDARPLRGLPRSKPVRIGNGAADQLQLDIYGELLDSVYLYNKYGAPISYDLWRETAAAASTGSGETGSSRTRASGRCAAGASTSSTRGS